MKFKHKIAIEHAFNFGMLEKVNAILLTLDPDDLPLAARKCIHMAVKHGWFTLVNYFLALDSTINTQPPDSNRSSLLEIAAEHGHNELVSYLVEQGANVHSFHNNSLHGIEKATPLHFAVIHQQISVVNTLLEANALSAPWGDLGEELILIASRSGYIDIVKLLIAKNPALKNARSSEGKTPLIQAVKSGNLALVVYLIEEIQVNLYATTLPMPQHGYLKEYNALQWAALSNQSIVIRYLLTAYAITNTPLDTLYDLMEIGIGAKHIDIVKLLINLFPHVIHYQPSPAKINLLSYACCIGCVDIVTLLLDNGAIIKQQSNLNGSMYYNRTPFHCAVTGGNLLTLNALFDFVKHDPMWCIIHTDLFMIAAKHGHIDIIEYLLDKNPGLIHAKNTRPGHLDHGLTAYQLAYQYNESEVINTLLVKWMDIDPDAVFKVIHNADQAMQLMALVPNKMHVFLNNPKISHLLKQNQRSFTYKTRGRTPSFFATIDISTPAIHVARPKRTMGTGTEGTVREFVTPDEVSFAVKEYRSCFSSKQTKFMQRNECHFFQRAYPDATNIAYINDNHEVRNISEFISGEAADTCITKLTCSTEIVTIIIAIIDSVELLHKKNIVHGDIKLNNILLCQNQNEYTAYPIDFGFSHDIGVLINTPCNAKRYAPELRILNTPLSAQCNQDVHCVAYLILQILTTHQCGLAISEAHPSIIELVERGLSTVPDERPMLSKFKAALQTNLIHLDATCDTSFKMNSIA